MLSPAIQPHLPASVNADDCTALLTLKSGLDGSYGETHFVGHGDSVLVLTRAGSFGEFALSTLPPDRLPSLYKKSWRNLLSVQGDDGEVHELELSEDERRKATAMLETLYKAHEAWPELATLMSVRIQDQAGNQRLDGLMQLGDIYLVHLDAPEKAYTCFAEVHDNYSHRDTAIAGMERIVDGGYLAKTIAPLLEERYRRGHNPEKLSWLLSIKAPTLATSGERAAAYTEAAKLTRQLDQLETALVLAGNALVNAPADTEVVTLFDELTDQSCAWQQALSACEQALHDELPDEARWELLSRIVTLCVDRLQNWERAETATRALLAIDDQHEAWWRALDTTYTALQRWPDLVEIIERRAELANPGDQAALLYRLGNLFASELGAVDNATATFYRVLDIDGTHADSFARLEVLHREHGEHTELRELLTRWLVVQTDKDQRIATATALAHVCEKLDDLDAAIKAWARILVDDSSHRDAFANQVRIYCVMKDWSAAVETLLRLARTKPDNARVLFGEAAELAVAKLNNATRGLDIYLEAHGTCGVDRSGLDAICKLATQLGRDAELIKVLRELIAMDNVSMEDALAYRMALADALQRSNAPDEAIEILQFIVEAHPDNAHALASLYQLYTATERWPQLADIITHTAKLTTEPELKLNILLELAELCADKLNELERANSYCDHVLRIDSTHEHATALLFANLTTLQDWPRLLQLYRSRDMHTETAALQENHLGDLNGALLTLTGALKTDWRNQELAGEVARLAQATDSEANLVTELEERFDELSVEAGTQFLKTIDFVIARFEAGSASDALLMAIGDHFRRVRADFDEAAKRYVLVGGTLHLEAMRRLRDTLRQAERWHDLATLLEKLAGEESLTSAQRRAAYRELHELYSNVLNEPDRAKEALRRSKNNATLVITVALLLAVAGAAAYWFLLQP